ncbi:MULTISPECIES: hypothetical protein [Flavobacteriaceae]|uniref:Uncharacterized protein n=2 Tax=Flavobacteriaceae TaxID=49546 RepID=A0A4Y8ATT2_9FLAO|nr:MULTISPECIES: hypothetical protein [Flavobacteriaceae]TEW74108.1 hypothetical protein E2488_11595 [Gramella jeungdoensis]
MEEQETRLDKQEKDLLDDVNEFSKKGKFSETFTEYEFRVIERESKDKYDFLSPTITKSNDIESLINRFKIDVVNICEKTLTIDENNRTVYEKCLNSFIELYSIKFKRDYLKLK